MVMLIFLMNVDNAFGFFVGTLILVVLFAVSYAFTKPRIVRVSTLPQATGRFIIYCQLGLLALLLRDVIPKYFSHMMPNRISINPELLHHCLLIVNRPISGRW